jgi:hypothetical protein
MLIDASLMRGYLFRDAGVTRIIGVELGPLPLLGWERGGRNLLEAREVA